MADVLSRLVERLVGFVREVDLGIAVGYGYESPAEKDTRARCRDSRARQGMDRRCRKKDEGSLDRR